MTNQSEQQPYYRTLTRKMFVTIITVSSIPVFLVSATIFYQFRTSHREKIFAHLNEMVQKQRKKACKNQIGMAKKKVQDQGEQILRSEAYGRVRRNDEG